MLHDFSFNPFLDDSVLVSEIFGGEGKYIIYLHLFIKQPQIFIKNLLKGQCWDTAVDKSDIALACVEYAV